jgi:hypothetical protein
LRYQELLDFAWWPALHLRWPSGGAGTALIGLGIVWPTRPSKEVCLCCGACLTTVQARGIGMQRLAICRLPSRGQSVWKAFVCLSVRLSARPPAHLTNTLLQALFFALRMSFQNSSSLCLQVYASKKCLVALSYNSNVIFLVMTVKLPAVYCNVSSSHDDNICRRA